MRESKGSLASMAGLRAEGILATASVEKAIAPLRIGASVRPREAERRQSQETHTYDSRALTTVLAAVASNPDPRSGHIRRFRERQRSVRWPSARCQQSRQIVDVTTTYLATNEAYPTRGSTLLIDGPDDLRELSGSGRNLPVSQN